MLNYNLLGGPLFEEFGWRGFLQSRMQDMMPPWAATIVVGIMWTAWHWPLFIVHFVNATPTVFALTMVGMSMVMALPFNASGRAVTVAILMHAAFNASSRFVGPFFGNTPTRSSPSAELLLAISFLSLGIIIALATKGRMAAASSSC
jgi:membrane protease YdiL (CAAX protease family)